MQMIATIQRLAIAATVAITAYVSPVPYAAAQMTIATGVDPGFSYFYVVTLADIVKKHGLELKLQTGPSGAAMVPLVISNQSQASMSSALAGINNHIADNNVVAVAQTLTYDRF